MNPLKNHTFTIKITGVGSDGQGVGRLDDGRTVFVPDTLPDEIVSALIINVKKNYCIGKLLEVLMSSPRRVEPPCPAAGRCGGCGLLHCDYPYQLELKERMLRQAFIRIGRFEEPPAAPIIGMPRPFGYRNKSSFPVGVSAEGTPVMGFYSRHSHRVIPISGCMAGHEVNTRIIHCVTEYISRRNVSVYNENSRSGLLRHVLTRVGFTTGEVMVCLVINGEGLPDASSLVESLKTAVPGFVTLTININKARTNVILGDQTRSLYGPGVIHDYIGDLLFEISPASFFQVNPVQTKVLYDTALEFAGLTGNETVIDAFCGIGTIALFLARRAGHVYGVEIVSDAVKDARRNAKINQIENVTFYNESAEAWLPGFCERGNIKPDIVIVDPPRKGCADVLLRAIADLAVPRVIYVSCDMGTLARDARLLADMGYSLLRLQPVDMFPYTAHVECVALFVRFC
ncbi:MAG: 23S rRNA (uracil(1939)-C(5))-methyltransferase RlmD [Clostridiales bacterium]|jgi:23S rRNA (uracil1939-C5)-methyltransferase|nr:23S rRNA (uracil(1939)-C(5))-methyltransferase RlmD [Clostridiales bacterium]